MMELASEERWIRRVLISRAQDSGGDPERACIDYQRLGQELRDQGADWRYPGLVPPFRGLGDALGRVSGWEWRLGRPLLSALVVRKGSGLPGPGFVDVFVRGLGIRVGSDPDEWVREEQRRVAEFWSDPDPTRVPDAAAASVIGLLERLRREIRREGSEG